MVMQISTAFWIGTGFTIFAGVLGYYLGERGWTGVQNDLNNVKQDIAHIKGVLTPTTVVAA